MLIQVNLRMRIYYRNKERNKLFLWTLDIHRTTVFDFICETRNAK